MYFPYLRGRQNELLALQELVFKKLISDEIIPIVEPIKITSTLNNTVASFIKEKRKLIMICNSNFCCVSNAGVIKNGNETTNDFYNYIRSADNIIRGYIVEENIVNFSPEFNDDNYVLICPDKSSLYYLIENYDQITRGKKPNLIFAPNNISVLLNIEADKVVLEDCFEKKPRNIDYSEIDEVFSDAHITFVNNNYIGFSDYSIVGDELNMSGFAPVAVAIHLVFLENNLLKIHHYLSDTNYDTQNTALKFSEAMRKVDKDALSNKLGSSAGLNMLLKYYKDNKFPGLGVVKKLSIMHHLEIMNKYLEEH